MGVGQDDTAFTRLEVIGLAEGDDIVVVSCSCGDSADLPLGDTTDDEVLTTELASIDVGIQRFIIRDIQRSELHRESCLLELIHAEEEAFVELDEVLVLLQWQEHKDARLRSGYL